MFYEVFKVHFIKGAQIWVGRCKIWHCFPEYHLVLSYPPPTQPPSRERRILRAGVCPANPSRHGDGRRPEVGGGTSCSVVRSLVCRRRNVFSVSTVCPQALVSWVALLDCVYTQWVGIEVSVSFSRLGAAANLQQLSAAPEGSSPSNRLGTTRLISTIPKFKSSYIKTKRTLCSWKKSRMYPQSKVAKLSKQFPILWIKKFLFWKLNEEKKFLLLSAWMLLRGITWHIWEMTGKVFGTSDRCFTDTF
jgi:hypothetical protein